MDLIERKLYGDIRTLSNMGVTGISKSTALNWPGVPFSADWFQYLPPDIINDLALWHQRYLDEYFALVRINFPTLWQKFPLAGRMPLKCFIWITDTSKGPMLCFAKCQNASVKNNQVISCQSDQISLNRENFEITYDGQRYKFFELIETALFVLTFPGAIVYPKYYMPFKIDTALTPLRRLVYEDVRSDLKETSLDFAISLGAAPYLMPGLFTNLP